MEPEIKREFDRLNAKLTALLKEKKKKTWVKAPVITKLTGWDNQGMRQARQNGYVGYEERRENGKRAIYYDLDSIHEHFIIKKAA